MTPLSRWPLTTHGRRSYSIDLSRSTSFRSSYSLVNNLDQSHYPLQGDVCTLIKGFPSSHFDLIIHDPPARAICGTDLYGLSFYADAYKVLRKPGGCLFHYIGNPASKESGRLYKGIIARLREAGFRDVSMAPEAFGLVAFT